MPSAQERKPSSPSLQVSIKSLRVEMTSSLSILFPFNKVWSNREKLIFVLLRHFHMFINRAERLFRISFQFRIFRVLTDFFQQLVRIFVVVQSGLLHVHRIELV